MKTLFITLMFFCINVTAYAIPYYIPIDYSPMLKEHPEYYDNEQFRFDFVHEKHIEKVMETSKYAILKTGSECLYIEDDPYHPKGYGEGYYILYNFEKNRFYILSSRIEGHQFSKQTPIMELNWIDVTDRDDKYSCVAELAYEIWYNEEFISADKIKRFDDYEYYW